MFVAGTVEGFPPLFLATGQKNCKNQSTQLCFLCMIWNISPSRHFPAVKLISLSFKEVSSTAIRGSDCAKAVLPKRSQL